MFTALAPPPFAQRRREHAQSLAQRELVLRQRAADSLHAYIKLTNPDYIDGIFTRRLIARLARFTLDCERGLSPHLMVFAPPRHGKSEVISRALPTWFLGRNPSKEVIAASSGQDLADEFGLFVRNRMNEPLFQDVFPDCRVDPASNAISRVSTLTRGGYRAVGVGGQVVGRGGHLLIVDDPIKGRAEAYSATHRKALHDWYRSNLYTRRAPGAGVLLMHQRWHPEDLAGSLLTEQADPDAPKWDVLSLPAIAEEDDEYRLAGEALFPERWPLSELRRIRATLTPSEWLAMYQQRPVKEEGGWFKADWFQFYSQLPSKLYWYVFADFAVSTSSYADDSAIIPVGIDADRNLYIAPDFFLGKLEPLDAVDKTLDLLKKYDARYLASDDNVIEKVLRPIFRERMAERNQFVNFHGTKRTEKKHIVAATYHARMQQRKVWFPDNPAVRRMVMPEHLNFIPDADNAKDNFIDGMANGCVMLDTMASPAPPIELPKLSEEQEDEAMWDRIMSRAGAPASKVPFARLNGDSYCKSA